MTAAICVFPQETYLNYTSGASNIVGYNKLVVLASLELSINDAPYINFI